MRWNWTDWGTGVYDGVTSGRGPGELRHVMLNRSWNKSGKRLDLI